MKKKILSDTQTWISLSLKNLVTLGVFQSTAVIHLQGSQDTSSHRRQKSCWLASMGCKFNHLPESEYSYQTFIFHDRLSVFSRKSRSRLTDKQIRWYKYELGTSPDNALLIAHLMVSALGKFKSNASYGIINLFGVFSTLSHFPPFLNATFPLQPSIKNNSEECSYRVFYAQLEISHKNRWMETQT